MDSKEFFFPRSIAIIGASTKPFKFGGLFLKALLDFQYPGKIYPVNARAASRGEKIQGIKSFVFEEISDPVDLVYITVPAEQVPSELRKCAKKGYKSIIILTAGFKEAGVKGIALEEECLEIAKKHDLRVIGPNCFGIYHPKGQITLLPGGNFPKEGGKIAMLSQSGGHSVNFVLIGQSNGMRFSKVISYGNALTLDLPDFLEYFNADSETSVVAAYVEGVRNIRKLQNVVKDFKKPFIMWKSGLTEDGARASTSHTGFLSGQAEIWKGFFQQNKQVVATNNFEELLDTTKALYYLPTLGKRDYTKSVGVIGGGGGIGIEISDVANQCGLKIPKLTEETKSKLIKLLPVDGTSINNPLDIGNPMYMGDNRKILEVFLRDPSIEVLILDFIVDFVLDLKGISRILKNYLAEHQVPMIIIFRQMLKTVENLGLEKRYRKFRDKFHELQVPVYPSFYRGVRALANYLRYYQFKT